MKLELTVATFLVAVSGVAHAQSSSDVAAAEGLFNDATRLIAEQRYAEACPKLAESVRLDPGIGALLYLADCYEHVGRTASAWAKFREAEYLAQRQRDARADVARQRASALEPSLAHLTIHVAPSAAVPGLEVRQDGEVVGEGRLETSVPVDPGAHSISARAPHKVKWTGKVEVAAGASGSVTIPPLEDSPEPVEEGGSAGSPGSSRRVAGLAVGAAGVVGLGLGAVFGLVAMSKYNDSNSSGDCQPNDHCNSSGTDERHSAYDFATVSTVAFALGTVAVAGGALLYFTAPKVAVSPTATGQGGGIVVRATF